MAYQRYVLKLFLLISFGTVIFTPQACSMQLLARSTPLDNKLTFSPLKAGLFLGLVGVGGFWFYHKLTEHYHKKLYASDFPSLGVRFLNKLEYEAAQVFLIPAHDHPLYKCAPVQYDSYTLRYGSKIARHYQAPLYLKFINKKVGYGVFADHAINTDEMIAEYTGIVRLSNDSDEQTDYAWYYPGIPALETDETHQEKVQLSIDAQHAGNFTRFVNHSYTPNVSCLYVPCEGQWHVIYVAKRPIQKDEQLLVNYGCLYWFSRKVKPTELNS